MKVHVHLFIQRKPWSILLDKLIDGLGRFFCITYGAAYRRHKHLNNLKEMLHVMRKICLSNCALNDVCRGEKNRYSCMRYLYQ